MTKGMKLRVVYPIVIPTLTYGCEACAVQANHRGYTGYTDWSVKMNRGGLEWKEQEMWILRIDLDRREWWIL